MKELPKVFHNQINKKIDNNETVFYSNTQNTSNKNELTDTRNILQKKIYT